MTKFFLKKVMRGPGRGYTSRVAIRWVYVVVFVVCSMWDSPKETEEGISKEMTHARDTLSIAQRFTLYNPGTLDRSTQTIDNVGLYDDSRNIVVRLEQSKPNVDSLKVYKELQQSSQIPSITPLRIQSFWISSVYGMRKHPISGNIRKHKGYDLAAPKGSQVHATASGQVKVVGLQQGYGRFIILSHSDGYETLYAHLEASFVKLGDSVHQGQVIASVGNSGNVTGFHLHYELMHKGVPVDPQRSFGHKRRMLRKWLQEQNEVDLDVVK